MCVFDYLKEATEEFFGHLCLLVDDAIDNVQLLNVTKDIILEGWHISVYFMSM